MPWEEQSIVVGAKCVVDVGARDQVSVQLRVQHNALGYFERTRQNHQTCSALLGTLLLEDAEAGVAYTTPHRYSRCAQLGSTLPYEMSIILNWL